MNNIMMMGIIALGGLGFFIWASRRDTTRLVEAPPAAQQRPDNPPANLTYSRRNVFQTGGAGTGYGIDVFGDEG